MEFHTMGFNPYFHSADKVEEVMSAHADVEAIQSEVTHVFFYGAGSSSAPLCAIIEEGLQRVFRASRGHGRPRPGGRGVQHLRWPAWHNMHHRNRVQQLSLRAAPAVSEEVPALAYILGDEASGSWHGKKLLAAKLYHQLPAEIEADFDAMYGLTKDDIVDRVYLKGRPQRVPGELHDLHWQAQDLSLCSKPGLQKVSGRLWMCTSSVLMAGPMSLCISSAVWPITFKRS